MQTVHFSGHSSLVVSPTVGYTSTPAQPQVAAALTSYQPLPVDMVHRLKVTGQ